MVATDDDMVFTVSPRSGAGSSRSRVLDVTDSDAVDHAVASLRPDAIVHLAAIVGSRCDVDVALTEKVNVTSVELICDAAQRHGVGRIVLASTAAVYGTNYSRPISEGAQLSGDSNYALSKIRAERALDAVDISTVALRIFNVFGANLAGSLVTRLIHSTDDDPVGLFDLDGFSRDYVHVADVADAIRLAVSAPLDAQHMALNIGSGKAVSNRELIDSLEQRWPVHYAVLDGPKSYSCADVALAHRVLGFNPTRMFADAAE
jgi:nucleoside-diphosphate-sugar epimerase